MCVSEIPWWFAGAGDVIPEVVSWLVVEKRLRMKLVFSMPRVCPGVWQSKPCGKRAKPTTVVQAVCFAVHSKSKLFCILHIEERETFEDLGEKTRSINW
jgi:NAD-dependent DNA ligase